MWFPVVIVLQKEDSLTLSSDGISSFNNPRVVDVVEVVVGARVVDVVEVVVGGRVVDVVEVVVGGRVVEVVEVVVGARVVLGSAGFGLTVYIKPASKASCSFRQVNTVFVFPSES